MKIELKDIKFFEEMSEETNAFTANIVVNGKKVGYAKNDGQGGCTFYNAYSLEDRKIINEAEQHCLGLPPVIYDFGEFPMNLEVKIDQLFEEWLKEKDSKKFQKRLEKDMLKALCIKTDGGYEMLTWKSGKKPVEIAQMLRAESGKKMLRDKIAEMQTQGRTILNTNIPQELFQ